MMLSAQTPKESALWQSWLDEDVRYLITNSERDALKNVKTAEEARQFLKIFWWSRDPTPDTQENEYKEEHYLRIAVANERFAASVPGWQTDRGMIYIKYGPPDEIDARPGEAFEVWRYRYISGIGVNVEVKFVDAARNGEYSLAVDPKEKEALLLGPDGALISEGNGQCCGIQPLPEKMNEFTRLEIYAGAVKPAAPKFRDLAAMVDSPAREKKPMLVRIDYLRVTKATVFANLMVANTSGDGLKRIYARVSDIKGRSVDWFEDAVAGHQRVHAKRLLLMPGTYRFDLIAEDSRSDINIFHSKLTVPACDGKTLCASSVILGDQIDRSAGIASGLFVIRSARIRPRMDAVFRQSEEMNLYAELYNFGVDRATNKLKATASYQIVNNSDGRVVIDSIETLSDASPFLVTVQKKFPLKDLAPGRYTLRLKVEDLLKKQTITPSAEFTVTGS